MATGVDPGLLFPRHSYPTSRCPPSTDTACPRFPAQAAAIPSPGRVAQALSFLSTFFLKKTRPLSSFRRSSGAMQMIPLQGPSRKCRLPSWGHGPCRMSSCFCNLSFFTNLFKNQRRIWKNRVEGEGGVLSIFGVRIERY